MPKPRNVANLRKGMLIAPKSFRPSRMSRWQNKKHYRAKDIYNGHYIYQRGIRMFVLANDDGRVEKWYPSHECAKAWDWKKLSK